MVQEFTYLQLFEDWTTTQPTKELTKGENFLFAPIHAHFSVKRRLRTKRIGESEHSAL
jgi:hypothetical protein